ncbi:MAG: hypothetical protein SOI38_03265 [Eggerthellaceae bacterium]|jgi:hypothetical protein
METPPDIIDVTPLASSSESAERSAGDATAKRATTRAHAKAKRAARSRSLGERLGGSLVGIALVVVGIALVALGIPMLILPGPGLLAIMLGFGCIAQGLRRLGPRVNRSAV